MEYVALSVAYFGIKERHPAQFGEVIKKGPDWILVRWLTDCKEEVYGFGGPELEVISVEAYTHALRLWTDMDNLVGMSAGN